MVSNEKIEKSYETLRLAAKMSKLYYQKPLIITYSGGKDSDVMLQLALECLRKDEFEVLNSHTTVDAPPTVYHIRKVFKHLESMGVKTTIKKPMYKGKPTSMWKLIVEKNMPPTRIARYCCKVLKESNTLNRMVAVGVREDESTGRKGRKEFGTSGATKKEALYFDMSHVKEVFTESEAKRAENMAAPNDFDVWDCKLIEVAKQKKSLIVNPIYHWTDAQIWNFIRDRKIEYCTLYDMGYSRVGCIGCPLATYKARSKEFSDFPTYKANYIKAFDKMLDERKKLGKLDHYGRWRDGESIFRWWIKDPVLDGQLEMAFDGNEFVELKEH